MILGVGRTPFAFLPNSWGGDLVARAGGRLITAGRQGERRLRPHLRREGDRGATPTSSSPSRTRNPDDIDDIERYDEGEPGSGRLTKAGQTGNIYVSTDNSLLQAGTDVARVIRDVREQYLKNR